jgi:hypothetical protein
MALDDRRLNKMLTETGQILSTAIREIDGISLNEKQDEVLYKSFNPGHEVNKWVRSDSSHFMWTLHYLEKLSDEYKYRKGELQKTSGLIPILKKLLPKVEEQIGPTRRVQQFCNYAKNKKLGLDFTNSDVETAYKKYLIARWNDDMPDYQLKWTKRGKPDWMKVIKE